MLVKPKALIFTFVNASKLTAHQVNMYSKTAVLAEVHAIVCNKILCGSQ